MKNNHIPIQRWNGKKLDIDSDYFANESVLEIRTNDLTLTKLLYSSGQELELAIGHLISEGYCNYDEIKQNSYDDGIVRIELKNQISRKNYSELVMSSCGACDRNDFETIVNGDFQSKKPIFSIKKLHLSLVKMKEMQTEFEKSGGMHCSALVDVQGTIRHIAEDIGRHNATDKVLGKAIIAGEDLSKYALLLSGRCAWDLCSKAIRSGIACVASIGAISDLAAQTARANLLPLAGFLREENGVIIGKFHETNEQH